MAIMDVMIDGKYLDHALTQDFCIRHYLPYVPVLYTGKYNHEIVEKLANSNHSFLDEKTKPIEGVVIKPIIDTKGYMGRMIFKWIGDKYWLNKGNTDWK